MKAEELATQLRIGNLLYYKGTTHIAKVELIHNEHFDCRDEFGGFTPNGDYEPIPLSEEVLLKCGLNFRNGYGYSVTGFEGGIFKSVKSGLYEVYRYHALRLEIKYLHQLQNLYYALTGTELYINF